MKKLIIFVFLLSGILCFSQSMTKKWNSYNNQYEYFDSAGNMTAYEKYNTYTKQWEYYDLKNSQQTRQPIQYRDPAKVDLGLDILNQGAAKNPAVREYRDSYGNLVGVEIYNAQTKQWEYYDAKPVK